MDKYAKLRTMHLKQIEFVNELEYATKVEKGEITHEIRKEGPFDYYHLIDPKSGQIIRSGSYETIKSYCRLRGIKKEQIKDRGKI